MSVESVKQIISRAVLESEFRQLLLSDPAKALAGYELTGEERAIFQNLSQTGLDALAGNLEERVSRALKPGPHFTNWCN
jgi:hypothetical protein